jgi:uncharacterized SAM-binding protein YcdF (DUF218 family)
MKTRGEAPKSLRASGTRLGGGMRAAERGGVISKLIGLLVLCTFLAAVYFVRHPLLRIAGRFWIVEDAPQPSDAIVILGDDNYLGERAARAANLFHAGWAPHVVASGRNLRPYAGVAELMEHDLVADGVPVGTIVRFPHRAENTREEAAALSHLLAEHGWRRILLVTSNYHTRRARYICERLFPPGTELRVVPASDSAYNPDSWWESRSGLKIFFQEAVGMLVAMWELRHSEEGEASQSKAPQSRGPVPAEPVQPSPLLSFTGVYT